MDKTYSRTTLIVVCVIIGALAFFGGMWLKGSSVNNEPGVSVSISPSIILSSTPTPSPKAVLHSVRLTDQGPDPKTIVIRTGDAVSFTNYSDHQIWPISSDCSGFDARRGLNSSEVYSLVFTAKGTCHYYNHLFPYNTIDKGAIIVQ